ncbi:MAG: ATP-binding protein [Alphaproteobacteria bacterium]
MNASRGAAQAGHRRQGDAPAVVVRLLLVEDNPGDRRVIERLLADARMLAVQVDWAASIAEAVAAMARRGHDIALVDFHLPDGTALEVLAEARRLDWPAPLVVLTGMDNPNDDLLAMQVGAYDYLDKNSLRTESLERSIRYALDRKRLELEMRKAREAAEHASAMKSRFLANMSHELRTPINSVLGFSEMLMLEKVSGAITERQREYLCNIRESGQHLLTLINDLLDLAKAEQGRVELHEQRFDLVRVVEDLAEMLTPQVERKGLILKIEADSPALWIDADRRLIKQALLNLVSNAIKFIDQGGLIRVALSRGADGETVVSVVDSGWGMPPEQISAAFAAYVQLENAYRRAEMQGTGLGLALTKQFVEIHGGAIAIQSEVGVGSTVRFTLPASRSAQRGGSRPLNGRDSLAAVPEQAARQHGPTLPTPTLPGPEDLRSAGTGPIGGAHAETIAAALRG